MNLPFWPFTLVRPPGYTGGSVPTPAEIQELQEKVAASADGRLWTDFSLYKTWSKADVLGTSTMIGTYDPVSRRWILYDTTSGDSGQWSISGAKWYGTANASVDAFLYPPLAVGAILSNVAGVTMAGGQQSLATTNLKLARSVDGASSWTRIGCGAVSNATVYGFGYSATLVKWFASVAGEGTFASTDGGVTWSLVDPQGATTTRRLFIVREGASPLILAMCSTFSASTAYSTSTDGVVWTARTFPVALDTGFQGVYSERLGKFFQPTQSGIYSSPDGITWTLVTASYTTGGLAISDRVMLRGDGRASIDGAAWWPVLETTVNNLVVIASPFGGGCMVDNATDERFVSLQGGF